MKIRCQGKVRYFYFCDDYGILRLQPCNRTVPCNRNRMLRLHISESEKNSMPIPKFSADFKQHFWG